MKEDFLIRSFIEKREKEAAISKIEIKRNSKGNKIEVEIHSGRPGILVGHKGTELTKIYKNLRDITSRDEFGRKDSSLEKTIIVNIVELSSPDCEANLIADFIVEQLEKRVAFRRAIKKAIKRTQVAKVEGIKVQVSGRLNGAEIARAEWIREGRVPLQTLRADIDYAEKQAHTIYGVLGIKVWLFKGEII